MFRIAIKSTKNKNNEGKTPQKVFVEEVQIAGSWKKYYWWGLETWVARVESAGVWLLLPPKHLLLIQCKSIIISICVIQFHLFSPILKREFDTCFRPSTSYSCIRFWSNINCFILLSFCLIVAFLQLEHCSIHTYLLVLSTFSVVIHFFLYFPHFHPLSSSSIHFIKYHPILSIILSICVIQFHLFSQILRPSIHFHSFYPLVSNVINF